LNAGDVVLRVDGVTVNQLGLVLIRRMFWRRAGAMIDLFVERDETTFEARITLRKIV
jgi:hypothetical protein